MRRSAPARRCGCKACERWLRVPSRDHGLTVTAHQDDRISAEHFSERIPQIRVDDQDSALVLIFIRIANFEQRCFRRQEARLRHDRLQRYSGQPKRDHSQIVGVDDGLHVAARLVNFAVDVTLAVQPGRIGRNRFAIETDFDDIGAGNQRRRHGARHEK